MDTSAARGRSRIRTAAGLVAALVVVGGVLVAAVAATVPIRIRHDVAVPQLREQGNFDKQLVPTGRTEPLAKTDTCIPLRRIVATGGSHDPAVCNHRDDARLAVAATGLSTAGAGALVVLGLVAAGLVADRRRARREREALQADAATRRGPRPRSTPVPR